jgi:hypothetical protein
LGIGTKSERYVIQILDSKSSRKAAGQPPSGPSDSSYARDDEKLLDDESGGVSGAYADGIDTVAGRLGLEMSWKELDSDAGASFEDSVAVVDPSFAAPF